MVWFNFAAILLWIATYAFFEGLFGWTIGKLITGTRVVRLDADVKPPFLNILGRSFARLIPFEPLSFFGTKPGGWHDHLSKTRTVHIRKEKVDRQDYQQMVGT
jgi:uncharacterized RDD family membrane protein YckC